MRTAAPYPGTQAIRRAFALLRAFTDGEPERGLAALARSTGLNKTTAYRLLAALEHEGMVARRIGAEEYRLGPESIALGARAQRANDLRTAARPFLQRLAADTGETATLEILRGDRVLCVDEVQARHVVGTTPSVGLSWPAHATSTGKVLLAALPEAERKHRLKAPLERFTPRTIATLTALRAELERTQQRGYGLVQSELEVAYVALGAPIRDAGGRVVAAVSVGGPEVRLPPSAYPLLAGKVREAADGISRQLGHSAA